MTLFQNRDEHNKITESLSHEISVLIKSWEILPSMTTLNITPSSFVLSSYIFLQLTDLILYFSTDSTSEILNAGFSVIKKWNPNVVKFHWDPPSETRHILPLMPGVCLPTDHGCVFRLRKLLHLTHSHPGGSQNSVTSQCWKSTEFTCWFGVKREGAFSL